MKKLFACICLLLLLPACGNKEPEKEKEFVFEGEATITVQPVAFLDSSTRIAIENYSASHPNVTFEILDPIEWSTRDIGLARVYADITKGTGPDIIIAEREDLSELVTKDCLLDISDSFSKATKKALLKSILEYGSYNGKTYLAPGNMNVTMLLTSEEYVKGGSWTIEDLISIIEEREKEGNPFEWIAITDYSPCEAVSVFDLFTRCLDSSNFIDWEKRTCSFDDPTFIKVMEISRKYDSYADSHRPRANGLRDESELLKEGKVLAVFCQNNSLIGYSEMQNLIGPGYSYIGFPCDKGNGKRVVYATNMAVNKNTAYAEVIKDFINSYYSLETCLSSGHELRSDLYDGRIEYDEAIKQYVIKSYRSADGPGDVWLPVRADGSDYSKEYFDLLNTFSATDLARYNEALAIEEIIYEEIEPFYSEDKTAEEVADLIQKRVSLLLSE